jgi:hypothetical protein
MHHASKGCRDLDDPQYAGNNVLLRINGRGVVLGYDNGSYIARPPYRRQDYKYFGGYPGATDSIITAYLRNGTAAGYAIDPNRFPGIWAFLRINGIWALLKDRREGRGANAVTEILDMNHSDVAVGFYKSAKGNDVPFILNVRSERFTEFKLPGAVSAEATGIDDSGDIVGFFDGSDGIQGFLSTDGPHAVLSYPGAKATWVFDVTAGGQIVGSYEDASGYIHGFMSLESSGKRTWQTVDDPNATSNVVHGINAKLQIVGSYVDSAGDSHGFLCR